MLSSRTNSTLSWCPRCLPAVEKLQEWLWSDDRWQSKIESSNQLQLKQSHKRKSWRGTTFNSTHNMPEGRKVNGKKMWICQYETSFPRQWNERCVMWLNRRLQPPSISTRRLLLPSCFPTTSHRKRNWTHQIQITQLLWRVNHNVQLRIALKLYHQWKQDQVKAAADKTIIIQQNPQQICTEWDQKRRKGGDDNHKVVTIVSDLGLIREIS
jgi:hypothetical protein